MKCQNLFPGKNKKNIVNLSSAELAARVVKVNYLEYSACTNSNNALFIDVTNFSVLQHRCDVIDVGQTLLSEMCKMRYLTGKTSILLQISRVFLMFRS